MHLFFPTKGCGFTVPAAYLPINIPSHFYREIAYTLLEIMSSCNSFPGFQVQVASLASAPPSVAFALFTRSITGRDELARLSYSECGLRSLRSLTHMGVKR